MSTKKTGDTEVIAENTKKTEQKPRTRRTYNRKTVSNSDEKSVQEKVSEDSRSTKSIVKSVTRRGRGQRAGGGKKLKVIPLGGLHEIGKNITCFEYDNEILVLDCGVAFPEDDMLGIDLVIPDFTYLLNNRDKVKGIVITHGHEDHIGSLPYLLRDLKVPVYGTKLTIGLIEAKLKEHNLLNSIERHNVNAGETVKIGDNFKVEFIRSNHSIADAVAMAITTPAGVVVHSGDFKIDFTPIQGDMIDLQRFAEIGKKGVLLFMCESTNVERPGYTMSERSVGAIFEQIFDDSDGQRIMVATFSSNIDRIQQIVNSAVKHSRKVAVIGRSMTNVVKTAIELGYLSIPKGTLIEIGEIKNYTDEQLVIIMTGSQGETMSALSRIAQSEHRQVEIKPSDKVSGHARAEEIKVLHALVKPKYFVPVHGEYKMLKCHEKLATDLGMDKKNVFVMANGDCLELNKQSAKLTQNAVPSGQVFVDGLGVGDVGNIVLRDRRHLSQDGLMIVVVAMDKYSGEILSGPDIISRGFVYVRESEELMDEARNVVQQALEQCDRRSSNEWAYIKTLIKDTLRDYLWHKTKRSPMILPIVMDIE